MMAAVDLGDTVSLSALSAFLVAAAGAVATVMAKRKGKAEGRQEERERRVMIMDQPLAVAHHSPSASQEELAELKRDIDGRLEKIERALNEERAIARTANGNLHARIDKSTEALAELKGEVHQIGANVSRLLELAMKARRGA